MNQLNRKHIEALAEERGGPHVSIYLPLRNEALHDGQNDLRLKNALTQAASELGHLDEAGDAGCDLLAPAWKLLGDPALTGGDADGMAVLVNHRGVLSQGLSVPCPELVVVAERFHLKPLIEEVFDDDRASRDEDCARVATVLGTDLAGSDVRELVPAACNGRIDTLLASRDVHVWGRYDRTSEVVDIHRDGRRPGDEDLLDLAAVESLRSGARVRLVEHEDVPGVTVAAAVFRYPRTGSDSPAC